MLLCTNGEILQDSLDYLTELIADERMPEELVVEITHKVDGLLNRIQEAGGRCHE